MMGATGGVGQASHRFRTRSGLVPEGTEVLCAIEGIEARPETRLITISQLWSVNVSTGEKRLITKGDGAATPLVTSWSPHCLLG